MGVLNSEIILLKPLAIQVGEVAIEVTPMIVGENTVIDTKVRVPDGRVIEINVKLETSLFNECLEVAKRHRMVPRLSALMEQSGHKPKLLPPKE